MKVETLIMKVDTFFMKVNTRKGVLPYKIIKIEGW
ncbi:hypothetical protein PMI17_00409 [Pantoea sp. GM01]|nr:hypothetical protein PMI17_00409 [Pantoea sp. GM01]